MRSYLVTGANKGQGYALCKRILSEYGNTHVYLCSRDVQRGREAKESLLTDLQQSSHDIHPDRIDVLQLDVTSDISVQDAMNTVRLNLSGPHDTLAGVVSNAGILWGYPLPELMDVCATGVKRVLDAFVPLCGEDGRVVVVTSGLGPLMHSYSSKEHQAALQSEDCTWDDTIAPLIQQCIDAYDSTEGGTLEERIRAFESIGFPGGPFAESAPDFHMYGLSKMFGDAYMLHVARKYPQLRVTSVDPGLVYTDLILKMPRYAGKDIGDTTAQTPEEGVEATMRVLFDNSDEEVGKGDGSGKLYAMKESKLVFSDIDKMPQKQ